MWEMGWGLSFDVVMDPPTGYFFDVGSGVEFTLMGVPSTLSNLGRTVVCRFILGKTIAGDIDHNLQSDWLIIAFNQHNRPTELNRPVSPDHFFPLQSYREGGIVRRYLKKNKKVCLVDSETTCVGFCLL